MKKYVVRLTDEERCSLDSIIRKGLVPGYQIKRAQCLLACDQSDSGPCWPDEQVAEAFGFTVRTVESIRKSALAKGVLESLVRKQRKTGPRPLKFTGDEQARLSALACSTPPHGHAQWSVRLLADQLVVLEVFDSVSRETVRRELKKTILNLGK